MYPSYSPLFTMGLLADHACDTLDLAHRPSRRNVLAKSSSWTCTHDLAPPRRRTSKESLRTIPSPKPAPSATLPDLPAVASPPRKRPLLALSLPRVRAPASARSESVCSPVRRKSRMDALACLEGRSHAPNRIPRQSTLRNNFMSLSDDEDDRAPTQPSAPAHVEDQSAFADVEDEADVDLPRLSRKRQSADPAKPARPRKRRSTLESWFPLKSFMDLKDDDLSSWNWRSFIEIGGVA